MNRSNPVTDPCINICRMDPNDQLCQGCWRTLREVGLWDQMNHQQKAEVAALLACRRSGMLRVALTGDSALENELPK
ncbi:DUF1289 domain-containing protein [Paraburkholderia phymatum]|uniref:DUF1289 domain-containing protein n=1 Tax=Paraburkholderia phymatum TaxID=148447 RepID=UPI003178C2A9